LIGNYIYVGLTDNLHRGISQHQNGENATTVPYRFFVLFHSEQFPTRTEARAREKYLNPGLETPA